MSGAINKQQMVWHIIFYGAGYLASAAGIIMLNKYILSVTPFHFPIVLSSLGVAFGWLMTALLYKFGVISLGQDKLDMEFMYYVKIVAPIGFFQATTLAAGNTAYFYLSLSFLQMCKALGPVLLFALLNMFGLDRWNTKVFMSIMTIVIGTMMAAWGDVSFTAIGFLCIFVAEMSEAAKSAWMQFLLANKSFSMWEGLYFISPASLFFLFIASACLEFNEMVEKDAWGMIKGQPHLFLGAGCLGFFTNLCSLGVIKAAGSLTLKVLSMSRSVLLILYGMAVYHDVVTVVETVGYGIVLIGFFWYNFAKVAQKEQEQREKELSGESEPLIAASKSSA
jgi:drug/metabolite transporter (DMT)-like permease